MIIYSVLLFIYQLLGVFGPTPKKPFYRFLYVAALLFPAFFLIAFRSINVGADTYPYSYTYERIASSNSLNEALNGSYMEVGYNFLEFVFGRLKLSYYGFQFVVAFFYYVSFSVFFYRYSENPAFSCVLFLTMQGLFGMMNQTRMWIAISIILFAVPFLKKRHFFRFLLVVALASFIHNSALIALIIYPFSVLYEKKKRPTILFSVLGGLVLAVFAPIIFPTVFKLLGRYQDYANTDYYGFGFASVAFFIEYFVIFLCIFYRNKHLLQCGAFSRGLIDKESNASSASLAESICLLTLVLSLAGIRTTFITRLVSFFSVYLFVILANSVVEKAKIRRLQPAYIFFAVLLTAQMFAIMVLRPEWDGAVPYEFNF